MIGAIARVTSAARSRRRDDAGFTVVELAITMMIAAIVSVAITGILVSQSNAERHVTQFTVNLEQVRQAMVEMQRDLRSAEPLIGIGATVDMRYKLDLKMYDTITSTTPRHVRWRADTVNDELVREVLDASGNVTATTYRLRGVTNLDPTEPLFRYYPAGPDAAPYVLSTQGLTPGDVAYCAVRVRIDLRALPTGGRQPVRHISEVQLRNKLPGADECPR
ncbi:MAG TPA: prepilin-type N-terminal cleavage/methylation domain-containing protein [Acidimicrobiales bacterium]|nr:prepilin-type N-terminal cleavage/methylation domain-containing protein [Acidimicrobiales bacterium]